MFFFPSGKSTFVKQMRIIHSNGYSVEDRIGFKHVVFSNTIQSMSAILKAMPILEIPYETTQNEIKGKIFLKRVEEVTKPEHGAIKALPVDMYETMRDLWSDEGVQKCFLW